MTLGAHTAGNIAVCGSASQFGGLKGKFALFPNAFIIQILQYGRNNPSLKTYAAISNAHLFRVCKRGKLSGSCLSTFNGFGSIQLPIFLCHIGVPTFSSQNN